MSNPRDLECTCCMVDGPSEDCRACRPRPRELTDDEVDSALEMAILTYDRKDKYPEWSNSMMRAAYRAGWEDGRNE